jgi:hypothetical protein
MSIITLVPSLGRPERATRMAAAYYASRLRPDTALLFLVDPNDATLPEYQSAGLPVQVLPEPMGFTKALNYGAALKWNDFDILGAFGDDVIFQTTGWDDKVADTLATPGLAYGDDKIHGKGHPSAVWISSYLVKTLGWLALPSTSHQWADDGWKMLGQRSGLLRYIPDVVVEHMHPGVGKADWDDTYRQVFNDVRAKHDFEGFEAWRDHWLTADLNKISFALDALASGKRAE